MGMDTIDYHKVKTFDHHIEMKIELVDGRYSGWNSYYTLVDENRINGVSPAMVFCGTQLNEIFSLTPHMGDKYRVCVFDKEYVRNYPTHKFYLLADNRVVYLRYIDTDEYNELDEGVLPAMIHQISWAFGKILRCCTSIVPGDAFYATVGPVNTQDQ